MMMMTMMTMNISNVTSKGVSGLLLQQLALNKFVLINRHVKTNLVW